MNAQELIDTLSVLDPDAQIQVGTFGQNWAVSTIQQCGKTVYLLTEPRVPATNKLEKAKP